jgi:hypothetical protein
MHPAIKMLIGIIFLIVPLALYAYEFLYIFPGTVGPYKLFGVEFHLLSSLWAVLQGIIPPFFIVIGIFIIWLELDEWKIEKELKTEEKKEKKKPKK